jgi:hypothetical protein
VARLRRWHAEAYGRRAEAGGVQPLPGSSRGRLPPAAAWRRPRTTWRPWASIRRRCR